MSETLVNPRQHGCGVGVALAPPGAGQAPSLWCVAPRGKSTQASKLGRMRVKRVTQLPAWHDGAGQMTQGLRDMVMAEHKTPNTPAEEWSVSTPPSLHTRTKCRKHSSHITNTSSGDCFLLPRWRPTCSPSWSPAVALPRSNWRSCVMPSVPPSLAPTTSSHPQGCNWPWRWN